MKDYYKILGVKPTEQIDAIKQAYRKLAKQYHPDLHPNDSTAAEHFKEINEAWEILGDTSKRAAYDTACTKAKNQDATATQAWARTRPPVASTTPAGYDDIMNRFGSYFSDENLAQKAKEEQTKTDAGKTPFDTTDFFNRFMGFKK